MILILTVPPSANALTRNVVGKGRRKTQPYKDWIKAAGWELKCQRRGREGFDGPVSITIALPESSGLDLDNCVKPTIDLLVRHKIFPDDRRAYVRHVSLEWQSADDKLHVTVELIEQRVTVGA